MRLPPCLLLVGLLAMTAGCAEDNAADADPGAPAAESADARKLRLDREDLEKARAELARLQRVLESA